MARDFLSHSTHRNNNSHNNHSTNPSSGSWRVQKSLSSTIRQNNNAKNGGSSSKINGVKSTTQQQQEQLPTRQQMVGSYALSYSSYPAKSKSFVFVKLTEQALRAIEDYVQAKGTSLSSTTDSRPTISFPSKSTRSQGVINIPSSSLSSSSSASSDKMRMKELFNFTISDFEEGNQECLRHESSPTDDAGHIQSLGRFDYKLKIQATDSTFEATRAKMTAASNEAAKKATKVIKETTGPKVGKNVRVHDGSRNTPIRKTMVNSSSASNSPFGRDRSPAPTSAIRAASSLTSINGNSHHFKSSSTHPQLGQPEVTTTTTNPPPNSQYHQPKSCNPFPTYKSTSASLGNGLTTATSSPSLVPFATESSPQLQDQLTPVSGPASNASTGSSGVSSPSGNESVIAERNRLKNEFNEQFKVYKDLYATLDTVKRKFTRLESRLANSIEGSNEWNRVIDVILKEHDELKRDDKFQETKKRVIKMHYELEKLKKKIQRLSPPSDVHMSSS